MKSNRSLALSSKIQELRTGDIVGLLEKEFPESIFVSHEKSHEELPEKTKKSRARVFTENNTLLSMVLTSVQQDKTLQNSVDLYYIIHQKQKQQALEKIEQSILLQKSEDLKLSKKPVGRPKKVFSALPKSLEKNISLNTAAYSKARNRVSAKTIDNLFKASRVENTSNTYSHWHGFRVFAGDGTYIQLQDTESIREEYEVKHNGVGSDGYPQGLLEVIIERGTGQIYDFKLSDRHTSELPLLYDMLDKLPVNSLLLLDDLYNCYEILAKCNRLGIQIVVPCKRVRNYDVVKRLDEGDEIITIKPPISRSKWNEENETPSTLTLRRITCKSPDGNDYILLVSILDKNIKKDEFQLLYLTRWDIEIGIREIKTIMDINVIRSKSPNMVIKELTVALATYNLIRKIIYASIKDLPFSPKEDLIRQHYSLNQNILIDKKGRIYNRWSTGRRRNETINSTTNAPKAKAE